MPVAIGARPMTMQGLGGARPKTQGTRDSLQRRKSQSLESIFALFSALANHQALGGKSWTRLFSSEPCGKRHELSSRASRIGSPCQMITLHLSIFCRAKIAELTAEISKMRGEQEQLERDHASYLSYEKKAEGLATEIKTLQAELADWNMLADNLNTRTEAHQVCLGRLLVLT